VSRVRTMILLDSIVKNFICLFAKEIIGNYEERANLYGSSDRDKGGQDQ